MTRPEPRCQCARWRATPCTGAITQEDLLCDTCREGCSLIAFGRSGSEPDMRNGRHVLMDPFDIRYEPQPSFPTLKNGDVIRVQTSGVLCEETVALLTGMEP